jgi:hypothetical protein
MPIEGRDALILEHLSSIRWQTQIRDRPSAPFPSVAAQEMSCLDGARLAMCLLPRKISDLGFVKTDLVGLSTVVIS